MLLVSFCFNCVQACVFFLVPVIPSWVEGRDVGLTLGWKAPCSELKGPECGSSGGMPGMVGG